MDINKLICGCEHENKLIYEQIDEIALVNQEKVLNAFRNNKIALRHFTQTSGYGYDDIGRDNLNKIFADIFCAEAAIVSPLIASGTHAIALTFFGLLRPGDLMLSISGMPYDTLETVIFGNGVGSLQDFKINFEKIDLLDNGDFNEISIKKELRKKPKIVYIQRSRGYSWRKSFSCAELEKIIKLIKSELPSAYIIIDNCYGEFVEKIEPTQVGADIVVGSLIKNPGGGIAPTGGYIAGKRLLVELIGQRLTAPGIGCEVGSYEAGYRLYYQGLFLAPHVVAQAVKGAILFGSVFGKLGYKTLPKQGDTCYDIICSIEFNAVNELIKFCQSIQKCSPIDSFAAPYPWDMPGYSHQVIMAAGTFVQGASIELSADAPIKEPFIAYVQGGITYEHIKIALKECIITLKSL